MTESNKILTVSYGTFSCTLEGFDDPFGTMRGIAEYFRDLAAEDRYFGAEPPTPDVEMLQNIAERDVQRRVEARIGETGVSLRAADAIEDAELSEAAPEPAEVPEEATAAPAAPGDAEAQDTEAAVVETPAAEVGESGPLAFDDEYLMADEPEDAFTIDANAEAREATPTESIAEKLRRIRAVVSRNIEPEKESSGPFEQADSDDEGSAFAPQQTRRERALSETIRSITADISDDDDVDGLDAGAAQGQDSSVSLFDEDNGDDEYEADAAGEAAVDLIADTPAEDDAPVGLADEGGSGEEYEDEVDVAATSDETLADLIAAVRQDDPIDYPEDAAYVHAVEDSDDEAEEPEAEPLTETEADEDKVAEAVAEAVAGIEAPADIIEEVEEPSEVDAPVEPQDEMAANAPAAAEEAVADADTDDVDAPREPDEEMAAIAPADSDETDDISGAAPAEREKSVQLEPLSETNGNVGRLLKATDEKFADDDGIRRRRVISQMRAAVAATKAERMLSKPISAAEQAQQDQSPYRRDLDQVKPTDVSPAPAEPVQGPETGAEAEADAPKPAPLVLVSSQRVDEASAAATASTPAPTPTKPNKRPVSEGASFAAFAEEMGAEELPDLLEAAAAFSAFVEGQPHFSRPEIMKRVARIDPALSLSREMGLRSFGMLLRQGKIRKLQRGQFAIAEDTRFNPAHRIAGQ